jgi:hypothetical protein
MQALNEVDENSKLEEDEDDDEKDQVDRARKNFRQLHDSDGDQERAMRASNNEGGETKKSKHSVAHTI